MDKNSNVEKFPFEYIIEPTSQNPDINLNIEIPWWDDEKHFLDQMKRDMMKYLISCTKMVFTHYS